MTRKELHKQISRTTQNVSCNYPRYALLLALFIHIKSKFMHSGLNTCVSVWLNTILKTGTAIQAVSSTAPPRQCSYRHGSIFTYPPSHLYISCWSYWLSEATTDKGSEIISGNAVPPLSITSVEPMLSVSTCELVDVTGIFSPLLTL